jgi:hypothetical protein
LIKKLTEAPILTATFTREAQIEHIATGFLDADGSRLI